MGNLRRDDGDAVLMWEDWLRFWEKVDRSGGLDACWPWRAAAVPVTLSPSLAGLALNASHLVVAN